MAKAVRSIEAIATDVTATRIDVRAEYGLVDFSRAYPVHHGVAKCSVRRCALLPADAQSCKSGHGIETSSLCIIQAFTSSHSTLWSARCWETLVWYWRTMRRVRCPRGGVGGMWSWSGQPAWAYLERPSAVVASRRHGAFHTSIAKSFAGTAHANTGCCMVCW